MDGVPLLDATASALRDEIHMALDVLGGPVHTLLLHALDPSVPVDQSLSALMDARSQGLATQVGVCNVPPSLVEQVTALPVDVLQYRLSWFDRQALRAGLAEQLVESPCQFSGFDAASATPTGWRSDTDPDLIRLSFEHDCTPRQAALAWAAAQCTGPYVICPQSSADIEDLVQAERLRGVSWP